MKELMNDKDIKKYFGKDVEMYKKYISVNNIIITSIKALKKINKKYNPELATINATFYINGVSFYIKLNRNIASEMLYINLNDIKETDIPSLINNNFIAYSDRLELFNYKTVIRKYIKELNLPPYSVFIQISRNEYWIDVSNFYENCFTLHFHATIKDVLDKLKYFYVDAPIKIPILTKQLQELFKGMGIDNQIKIKFKDIEDDCSISFYMSENGSNKFNNTLNENDVEKYLEDNFYGEYVNYKRNRLLTDIANNPLVNPFEDDNKH